MCWYSTAEFVKDEKIREISTTGESLVVAEVCGYDAHRRVLRESNGAIAGCIVCINRPGTQVDVPLTVSLRKRFGITDPAVTLVRLTFHQISPLTKNRDMFVFDEGGRRAEVNLYDLEMKTIIHAVAEAPAVLLADELDPETITVNSGSHIVQPAAANVVAGGFGGYGANPLRRAGRLFNQIGNILL